MPQDRDKYRTTQSYDIYDQGYRSGAQAQLFIGPIWVDQAVSYRGKTGSGDQPVYGYSSVYFDRVMLGRYLVSGSFAIAYSEPDYLLRVIQNARSTSIQESELKDLIESRKSIFADTLRFRTITNKILSNENINLDTDPELAYINSYVERISREVETISFSGGRFNPATFELTIIIGGLYDDSQSIEIFQDAKIIGSGKQIVNDDESVIEVYDFIAKRKPEKKKVITLEEPKSRLSRANIMQMASEVTDQLVEAMLEPPTIDVFQSTQRTDIMYNTNRLAIAGSINPRTRFYGNQGSFIEVVYGIEYPLRFKKRVSAKRVQQDNEDQDILLVGNDRKLSNIESDTYLEIYDDNGYLVGDPQVNGETPKQTGEKIRLDPPRQSDNRTEFDNSYGRIIAVDRNITNSHMRAVSTIQKDTITARIGGSIMMPRYKQSEFEIGSFIPPTWVDPSSFTYDDSDLSTLTAGTFWCALTGFRSTTSESSPIKTGELEDYSEQNYITELAQPLCTFAYVNEFTSEYTNGTKGFSISLSTPTYIDYLNTEKPSESFRGKRTKEPVTKMDPGRKVTFVFTKDGELKGVTEHENETTIDPESDVENQGAPIFEDCVIATWSTIIDVEPAMEPDSKNYEDFKPHFINLSATMPTARLASDFSKCLYVVPFVFLERDQITVAHGDPHTITVTPEAGIPQGTIQKLAYFLKTREGKDESCNCTFDFDWTTVDTSGWNSVGGSVTVDGVFFINWNADNHPNEVLCPEEPSGEKLLITDYGQSKRKAHIIWVMMIVPIVRDLNTPEEKNKVVIKHNIESKSGRYIELYNITRCDLKYHSRVKFDQYIPNIGNNPTGAWAAALYHAFENLIDVLVAEPWDYAMPIKRNLSKIAGFLDGYGFQIDTGKVADQILTCRFSEGISRYSQKNNPDPTLQDLIIQASGADTSNTIHTSIRKEIEDMVRESVNKYINLKSIRIIEEDRYGVIKADAEVITPAPDVVTYGIANDSGESTLLNIRDYNIQFKTGQDNEYPMETESTKIVTLRGYVNEQGS